MASFKSVILGFGITFWCWRTSKEALASAIDRMSVAADSLEFIELPSYSCLHKNLCSGQLIYAGKRNWPSRRELTPDLIDHLT